MFGKVLNIEAKTENIVSVLDFIEKELTNSGYTKKDIVKELLLSEEMIVQLIANTTEDKLITVEVCGTVFNRKVLIKCAGSRFDIANDSAISMVDLKSVDSSEEQTSIISNLILKSYADEFQFTHKNGYNYVSIKVRKSREKRQLSVFSGIALGLILGFIIRLLFPQGLQNFVSNKICGFVTYLFMNGVGMVVAPLVFFSVAESISGFSDIKSFGKVGAKVLGFYCMTSLIAIFIAYFVQAIFTPGNPSMLPAVQAMYSTADAVENDVVISTSIIDAIEAMIPTNIVDSFLRSDMIQIILIAVIVGVASGAIGEYSEPVQKFIRSGNALFSKIITYVVGILPLAVMCMMANLIITIDFAEIKNIAVIFGTELVSFACILIVYAILILVFCKFNPLRFFKNQKEAMLLGFSSCSSSVVMPVNMKCLDRFGVSPKVYSFSIPLGATINMDGAVSVFVITTFAMMRIYGIELHGGAFVSLMMSVFFLAIGSPCVAGAGIAGMIMLLTQVGIPIEAMAFVIPIMTLLDFFATMVNVTGDAVCTLCVANSEGLLDKKNI